MRRYAKIAFSAILVVVGAGFRPCKGQTVVSARAYVTATVVPGISVASPTTLDFGRLSGGTSSNFRLHPKAANGVDLAVSGPPAGMVWITFPSGAALQNSDGNLLSFTPEIYWKASNKGEACESATLDITKGSTSLSSNGPLLIKFSGSINTVGAADGSYRGNYIISVIY